MPFGLKRYQQSGQAHFVTFSCYRRRRYFDTAGLPDLFLRCLEQTRRRYGFRVYGYVVMPEHIHLLVFEPDVKLLCTAIQALKISVARRAPAAGWWKESPFCKSVITTITFAARKAGCPTLCGFQRVGTLNLDFDIPAESRSLPVNLGKTAS